MNYYIDTHAHLYLEQFDEDRDQVIQSARDEGVNKLLLPNIDKRTTRAMLDMETQYPGICYPMMGLHPCSVDASYRDQLNHVEEWLGKHQFCAVGEIGTDLYWDKTYKEEQELCFRQQLRWAAEMNLPVVIHSRDSLDWSIQIVEEEQKGSLTGVFHCFNGTVEQGKRIVDVGFVMGIGGVVTFKNAGVDKVVADLPLSHMVLETDAPYLTPVPHRGKRNESAYIPLVAQKLAEVLQTDLSEVMEQTTKNAESVFEGIS